MTLTTLLAWAKRNERHLSTLFFLGGFAGDIIAFTFLEVTVVNLIFAAYLVAGVAAILLSHYLFSRPQEGAGRVRRILLILLPLFVQYVIGSILSGSLIFYTKSATLIVSWPFLLLVAVVFFGNEIFRNYREHLAFQCVLFFFGLYAYAIFALPLILGMLGPYVFLGSTGIAVVVFALFLALLHMVGKMRLRATLKSIALGITALVLLMNALYFTGLIPPLPLGLKDVRIAHALSKEGGSYALSVEAPRAWWAVWEPEVVHHVPGTPVYAYTAVFAPIRFSTAVVHEWEWYDGTAWVRMNRVSFPIAGGRSEGYRGYSWRTELSPGQWRVLVKTTSGQTIGRTSFVVERVAEPPALITEYK